MESVLQSAAWRCLQQDLGHESVGLRGDGWSALTVLEQRRVGSYLYCPYGPVCEDDAALARAVAALREHAAERGAWWLRVEPMPAGCGMEPDHDVRVARLTQALPGLGMVPALHSYQPSRTRMVDLRCPRQEILLGMTGSNRTSWRTAHKRGVHYELTRDPEAIEELVTLLRQAAPEQDFMPRSADYLRRLAQTLMPLDAATLYVSRHEGEALSAVLVVDDEHQRMYAHAAMPARNRRLRPHQGLIIQAMLDAQERGQRCADLFGIAPTDDPAHPWAGFTAFKRSFGGRDVQHAGTWELPVNHAAHRTYRAAERARSSAAARRRRLRRH